MKPQNIRVTTLFTTALALLAFTGCSERKRDDMTDKANAAYQDTKAAAAQGWANLKDYGYEKRSDFSAMLKAQQAELEAGISKLRAEYSEANASASRKAAMAELKDAEADYKAKLSALGNATADTWAAARDNVAAAWDRLQASYAKARAS
jgi:hypothetical protein